MKHSIFILLIAGMIVFTAVTAFAGNYNSSLSNKDKSIVNEQVGNILLSYNIGGAEINKVTDALAVGIAEEKLITLLVEVGVSKESVKAALAEFDKLGIASDDTNTGSAVSVPSAISPVPVPPSTDVAMPPVSVSEASPIRLGKCGVNTYSVSNECGVGAFKNMYFQCYDGYEEKHGGESSCKSSDVWAKYAREICVNRCGVISPPAEVSEAPVPALKPLPEIITITEANPIAVCYIPDKLTKDYNQLLLDLRKAEEAGDKEAAEIITQKITALKLEIERARKECLTTAVQPMPTSRPIEAPLPAAPVVIDRCIEVSQWENKIAYYEKLANLSDRELKEQTGFSWEEVEKILSELPEGLVKVRAQCQAQTTTAVAKPMAVSQTTIAEPVKPVVVESGREVSDYYKAKIENITAAGDTEEQIQNLKSLKVEIDELIEKLIKGRKELEVSEFSNVVSEIKVSKGEIKADDVSVKTTDKKILVNIGESSVSVAPTSRQVLIQDKNLEVTASEISIKDNALRVGNSEVKLAASKVAENLNVSPTAIELKEENARAVYKMKVAEPRKLLWFIPIKITKTLTADAESSDLLKEKLPWYAFLTTK